MCNILVLSRTKDEEIIIGDDIVVTVVDLRGDKVRIGVSAPRSVSVHRKEVYDAIRRENAAGTAFVAMPDQHSTRTAVASAKVGL